MGRTYRTMNGRSVDMDKLRSQNELTPAVGNMKVNARGDELGVGGKITRTREQIVSSYYDSNPKATPDADVPAGEPAKPSTAPNNPPSQTMTIEDTQPSSIVEEVETAEEEVPAKQETSDQVDHVEEKVLEVGVEAVKRARTRRKGISDATGEK